MPKIVELAVDLVVASKSPHRPGISDTHIRFFRRQNFLQLHTILELPEAGLFVANDGQGGHVGQVLLLGNQIDSVSDVRQAWVYDLSVRQDWWGKGVGQALMARAERFVKEELKHAYIGLGVTSANERAVGFYERLGYQVERVQMVKRIQPDV